MTEGVFCGEGEDSLSLAVIDSSLREGALKPVSSRRRLFAQTKRGGRSPSVLLPPSSPERFPLARRLPVAPLVCGPARTFRSVVQIRSFCLRVFAFPFGAAARAVSLGIHHPTGMQLKCRNSYTGKPKNAGFLPLISYKLSITPALCKVKRKRPKEGEDSLSLAMLDSSLSEGASKPSP